MSDQVGNQNVDFLIKRLISSGPSPRTKKWSGGRQSACQRHEWGRVREGDNVRIGHVSQQLVEPVTLLVVPAMVSRE